MNKCLKITFDANFPEGFLQSFIHKYAKKLSLEGVVQIIDGGKKVRIIVCGEKDAVDEFLDIVYKGTTTYIPEQIEIEPFIKDKEYRGVFRVIE